MKNSITKIKKELEKADLEFLYKIYKFRCLTREQGFLMIYSQNFPSYEDFIQKKEKVFKKMIKMGIIKEVFYSLENSVFFLQKEGIELVKLIFKIPANIYDYNKKIIKRGYFTAGELEISSRLINHQVHLNQFISEFHQFARKNNINYRYYDEKYLSQYTQIRPDGMISYLGTDYFIETDMSTENKKQLYDKWENYRKFFKTREYQYKEKNIVVLFVCENTKKLKSRKDLVKHTIYEKAYDFVGGNFDIYIGSRKEILHLLTEKLTNLENENKKLFEDLFSKWGFKCENEELFKYKITDDRIHMIVDFYLNEPCSVITNVIFFDKRKKEYELKNNRKLNYLIICDDLDILKNDLDIAKKLGEKEIYVTTISLLKNNNFFYDAVYYFDTLGNLKQHNYNFI